MTTTTTGTTAAIHRTLELRSPPERVWRALTEAEEVSRWFGDSTLFEAREGAEGWFGWEKHGRYAVRVERCEPPRRFSWRWARKSDTPLDDSPSTLVEWELTPRGDGGTTLELTESGFARPEDRADNVGGWRQELGHLLAHLGEEGAAP